MASKTPAAPASAAARAIAPLAGEPPAAAAALLRLRPTLVAAVVGLVLLTAASVGGSIGVLALASTRSLIAQTRAGALAAATEEAREFFDTAARNTDELATEARLGLLPLDRPARLAALFGARLHDRPQLAWIGYGEAASGRYVGATREAGGVIVEYVADPQIADSVRQRVGVLPKGAEPPPNPNDAKPYRVRSRGWFKLGLKAPGPAWTDFYEFFSGGLGITCVTRFVAPGARAPIGVFHADLRVGPIAALLSKMPVARRGAVFLVDRTGHRLVSPAGRYPPAAAAAVDMAARRRSASSDAPVQIAAQGQTYEVAFAPVPVAGDLGLSVAVAVNRADITDGIYREAEVAGLVALTAMLFAIVIGVMLSTRIARPVVAIARDLATVGAFEISRRPAPRSFVREIADLGTSVDRMKASLRSFGRYVPTDLVRTLLAAGSEARLGGEVRRLTIFFSDIANFTAISEGMAPHDLVAALGRYFTTMSEIIAAHGGTIDKFIGDGVMAFFNAPGALADHPRQACLAAIEAQAALARLADEAGPGEPAFRTRIGLGLGEVLVGNIGTLERFAYTIIGDAVNLASRLEGLNKLYGTAIIASGEVAAEAGGEFEWRRLDRVAVKGRQQGTPICELLGRRGAVAAGLLAARDLYEGALEAYFAGDFAAAAVGFVAAGEARPKDLAAPLMAERARRLAAAPPPEWTGIEIMQEK